MEKNVRLVNIYIKIHNKRALTVDDMAFLAKWDPECFAKTCHNLVYNVPQTGKLMQSSQEPKEEALESPSDPASAEPALSERERVQNFLSNLKKLELNDLMVQDVSVENVKSLMGNLYMEMMFPHNDKQSYFNMQEAPQESVFNRRV